VQTSAWLNPSKDHVHGNDKKSDSLWGQNTKEFNQNSQRARSLYGYQQPEDPLNTPKQNDK
jgi:hypothetical protein